MTDDVIVILKLGMSVNVSAIHGTSINSVPKLLLLVLSLHANLCAYVCVLTADSFGSRVTTNCLRHPTAPSEPSHTFSLTWKPFAVPLFAYTPSIRKLRMHMFERLVILFLQSRGLLAHQDQA